MSKAEELANKTGAVCEKLRRTPIPISDVVPHMQAMADELRRLAALEEELNALKSALMDAEPVAWLHRNKGSALTADQKWLSRGDFRRPYADACDTPLYTLNGIKP